MSKPPDPAKQLRRSWDANAHAWSAAVREQKIESRRVATDAAILEAVLAHSPTRVLDVGCGEGWLIRALAARGSLLVGVDASAALIEAAREHNSGAFHVLSYAELAVRQEQVGGGFDAVVCNFSLLEEDVVPLLSALRQVSAPGGLLYVQTVHPWSACGEAAYRDGWRTETFASFGQAFVEPMPWYFRTLASWVSVVHAAGWRVAEVREPLHPETGKPLSLLLICGLSDLSANRLP
jgi:2-polyprenyl-3-methyl-5-hydroxy-6-metoxy-1,4-benzoquinol methylase